MLRLRRLQFILPISIFALAGIAGCTSDEIDSDEAAEAAYVGLDGAIQKSLSLGFDAFNAASSANVPPQMTTGDETGTLVVSGQVDQGSSDNKGMRLLLDLVEYRDLPDDSDELVVTYDTNGEAQPMLTLSLRGIPNATLTGTLEGEFMMSGDVGGSVRLSLTLDGMTEEDPNDASRIRRVAGSTTITGTATSDFGEFNVDVTL